ncbi:MAG: HAMP domain-containing histidine kinase [Clostridia bacterium]|nr:HAMP domain-containing histidine kinase [Clostridia bacterium]
MSCKLKSVKEKKKQVGIRSKLVLALILFTVFILLAIWVLQIRLLSYFYEREKFSELEEAYLEICEYIEESDFKERLEKTAEKRKVCIRVFVISDSLAKQIADADSGTDCMIHNLSYVLLADLYKSAKANGGMYDKRMEFNTDLMEESGDGIILPGMHNPANTVSAICVRTFYQNDNEYFVLLDSELTPVSATVNTLQVQFLWIACFLLVAAVIFATVLSRIIATPLTVITQKAGKLAAGNYAADFEGHGYREVAELAETLNFAAREIGATDHLQKELIANISHDLRTPLTMIKGYSEIMRDLPGENNAENAQIIIDETTRLSELVSDLLDLSKLQAGTLKPDPEIFDLSQLARDTLIRYDTLIRHNGYRILFESEGAAPVLADRGMILQVIYNLINNAVNYTGESLRVRVNITLREDSVRLAVSDDGEGIPPDMIENIWERYYRVDKVHNRAVIGTGLGLSIVKGILEAHHALYGVESAVGVGSVFWFELPLASENEEK